jgi:hypothetical protein
MDLLRSRRWRLPHTSILILGRNYYSISRSVSKTDLKDSEIEQTGTKQISNIRSYILYTQGITCGCKGSTFEWPARTPRSSNGHPSSLPPSTTAPPLPQGPPIPILHPAVMLPFVLWSWPHKAAQKLPSISSIGALTRLSRLGRLFRRRSCILGDWGRSLV